MRALLLLTALAGCASVTENDLMTISRLPNPTLCYESVAAAERYKPAIHQELAKRGENCTTHWPAVQARLQAENMARANRQIDLAPAAMGLQMMQPPYMIPPNQAPRQVQCTSRQVGPTVQTQCF